MVEGLSERVAALELALAARTRQAADHEREARQVRQANVRLRELVEAKDVMLAAQAEQLTRLETELNAVRLEVADLRRRVGQSSKNSSVPPSKDRLDQKQPKRGRDATASGSAGGGSKKRRRRGGQPGHRGSGLDPAAGGELAGRSEALPPTECRSCGDDLCGAESLPPRWAQVWDIPPVRLDKWAWSLPRRRCGCGAVSTAAVPGVPWARPGTVVYGPNVNAAAVVLSNYGTMPTQRCAQLMGMLVGSPVSTGFVANATARMSASLQEGGYDTAVQAALAKADVLGVDETPVEVLDPVAGADAVDAFGQLLPIGTPHILTVTKPGGLVWLSGIGSRSGEWLATAPVLAGFDGILVRDDYNGYRQFDDRLAAVQLCCAHLLRAADQVAGLDPDQKWAERIIAILTEANTVRETAIANGYDHIDPDLLAALRADYDAAVADGLAVNTDRAWHTGRHPGYRLARRLADKADQIWLFTTNFAVPFTNNASERALRMAKVRQKISGIWHTLTTLNDWCRIRSYLVNAANHGHPPIDAIRDALTGNPWLPALNTS